MTLPGIGRAGVLRMLATLGLWPWQAKVRAHGAHRVLLAVALGEQMHMWPQR